MTKIYDIISIPMGYILKFLMGILNNNFAAAVFIFTAIANIALLPLTMKSQKSAVQQTRLRPKLDELKKKCGDDKQRYTLEMQELYQRENVSMSGGCLPMIIRLLLMMGLYWAITNPLRYLCGVSASVINEAMSDLGVRNAMQLVEQVKKGAVASIPPTVLDRINFDFLGIDLTKQPVFSLNFSKANINWIIPIMSFAAQMLSSVVALKIQKKQNPDAPSMSGMMLTMPLISLFIGFTFPCALGFYWACSAIIGGVIQTVISLKFGPNVIIAKEQTKEVYTRYKKEKETLCRMAASNEQGGTSLD